MANVSVYELSQAALVGFAGEDAQTFLHNQLSCDVAALAVGRSTYGAYCTPKGRMLASFLLWRSEQGFFMQLPSSLREPIQKQLSKFILRSKVKVADESDAWIQDGVWDADREGPDVSWSGSRASVRVGERRYLEIQPLSEKANEPTAPESAWTLQEIRAGRPFISGATQDQFVPQMVNLEKLGGVDFQKGCYPGQEIVARAQYRGQVKRRMVQLPAPAGLELSPGQEFNGGVVVDSAGGELLAVMPI